MDDAAAPQLVHYIPVATTTLSAIFFVILLRRYFARRNGAHLLWWAGGVFCYGLGTGVESLITLSGNTIALNKAWYIAGALLGGYPLAQGSVYLLAKRRTANLLTILTVPPIIGLSVLVMLSPVHADFLEAYRPSGDILVWQWIRPCTPFINSYAALFLIGGAMLSAIRYARQQGTANRALGNSFIAVGAILPAVGGGLAKAGIVEGLYIGEFLGLILIWIGYGCCVARPAAVSVVARTAQAPNLQPVPG